jgi:hypothetical protein
MIEVIKAIGTLVAVALLLELVISEFTKPQH